MKLVNSLVCTIVFSCLSLSVRSEFDPETYMDDPEMIRYWGYPVEVHEVTTADGYILDMFRIPHGRSTPTNASCHRPAVLMVHGLTGCAAQFIVNPPESSPAFLFADAGFDVFLLNHRGTTYGRRHVTMKPEENKFWQFSLDEFAKFDTPAVIDKALELSGEKSLYYIGESQGTVVGFMTLAENPAYNSKVKALFQLAPVLTGGYSRGITRFLFLAVKVFQPVLDFYRRFLGSHETSWAMPNLVRPFSGICDAIPFWGPELCKGGLNLYLGPPAKTFNISRLPVYGTHLLCGTSTWTILQFAQVATRLKVEHMDHNPTENQRRYGQSTAPLYDYGKIDVPVYLFWSRNDFIGAKEMGKLIEQHLRKDIVKGVYEIPEYNHFDFGVATDNAEKVFNPIENIVRNQEVNMCER